jgi:cytochrome c oxidase assembly protein subunit 11
MILNALVSTIMINLSFLFILVSIILYMVGLSYLAVPLYRIFCQATGFGGTTQIAENLSILDENLNYQNDNIDSKITIKFSASTSDDMPWKFVPCQQEIQIEPGETALAFYNAYNPTDKPIIGIATYNVVPQKAGIYFNKIQCFCFEEQILNPRENIEMPIFFFIDPQFFEDPKTSDIQTITLSYTFFQQKSI